MFSGGQIFRMESRVCFDLFKLVCFFCWIAGGYIYSKLPECFAVDSTIAHYASSALVVSLDSSGITEI
jgi:hypothetical protein